MDVSRETVPTHPQPAAPEARLLALAEWLAPSAASLGLTNYHTADVLLTDAILPALALRGLLGHAPVGPWVDLGAGSGALGLALALTAPALHMDLLDRRERAAAFLDLTVRRMAIPNARALQRDLQPEAEIPAWVGVCFRAVAPPSEALAMAAAHSRRWVCAWHGPGLRAYRTPPAGFRVAGSSRAPSTNLALTLYERVFVS